MTIEENEDTSVNQEAITAAEKEMEELRAFADGLVSGKEPTGDDDAGGTKAAPNAETAKPKTADGEPEKREPSELEKLIAERESKAKERSSIIDGAEKERERILREARAAAEKELADAKRAAAEERERIRVSLMDKPLEKLRELGADPRRLMEDALKEDDPAYQHTRRLERALAEKDAEIAAIKKRIADWDKQTEEMRAKQEAETQQASRKAAEDKFLELAKASPEHEQLRQLYGTRERSFVLSAHAAADELSELIGRLPRVEEVVEYMVLEARKELANKLPEARTAHRNDGKRPQGDGAKQTTLGSRDTSVRRASTGKFSDLSDEEQREELVAIADGMLARS